MKKLKYLMMVALILVLGLLIYRYAINKDKNEISDGTSAVSEIDKMLGKDLENNYPVSAREVVSYFLSIQKCYYNEAPSDSQLVQLSYQAMKLFDEELVAENKFDEYFENLKLEVDEYKSAGRTIAKTILDKAADVIYSDVDGVKYAKINCIYYLKAEGTTTKVEETYALRKDNDGRWKILGWEIYTPSEYEE